jgi:RHS repeat-associated protein
MQTSVTVSDGEKMSFYWKVFSEQGYDYLQFYIDSTLKDQISGEVDWQQKSYSVAAGTHTLKWRYVKNGNTESGDDCGWVDFVQWTGPSPAQDSSNWQEIAYKHDVLGRRVEKRLVVSSSNPSDGYSTRYLYDGPHVIAEYDGNNNLLRKYIYGPGIDQPVCMIEVADANAVYYYHFDALGSVVALSDAAGDTVQTYEYSVYGEVAVEDANHPNPYMFAGVRYDIEIGLYYNRARYYNPYTGRFLQTDPIADGMNLYAYCGNNSLNRVDPSGLYSVSVNIPLQTIWHEASVVAHGVHVKNDDNPQHMSDVQGFLDESNFFTEFPGVTLTSVTYSGTSKEGKYHVVFEVPDVYDDMTMEIEEETEGLQILVVRTGHWYKFDRRKEKIWDWRLLGMLSERLARANAESAARYWAEFTAVGAVTAFAGGVLIICPATYPVSAPIFAFFAGWTVYDYYKAVTATSVAVPNYIILENYADYIFEAGGIDYVWGKYEDYKKTYNL